MQKYILSRTIKYRKYAKTVFAGTLLDETIVIPRGTYVEFIPLAYLDLFGSVNDCENCALIQFCESEKDKDDICDFCYENYTAQDLMAVFVNKDAHMCFEDSTEHTPDVSCSSNAKIIHKERLHYTQVAELVKRYKLVQKHVKTKVNQ